MDSKVAFITGVARGQGRAHAIELAGRGFGIIGVDICADIASMDYPNASREDLEETVRAVKEVGGEIVAAPADVRDQVSLQRVHDEGVARFGRIEFITSIANSGGYCDGQAVLPYEEREGYYAFCLLR
ncbi:SDR family NAD(P)-dependent oxidoreductase [Nocardia abscessus]|jgi:NAD(P)-dependent dehydrogenase (short-subunit alcohol dehydrogenase family)|uniref:SDR family NAD(P)-dependent oxidoreductase n=1 Tax=Nocardia TaxID=1817 RepID=UPI001895D309|nr:SDR family NAD(P)-dependent oxidoreductase [Nocardia abscessus]MBF6472508.1 SDR family NAD(P)-dependent oxidoreductase [Nocardia abscessus]